MRGLTRRWLIREPLETSIGLSNLRLPPLFERILLARGLADAPSIKQFCEPKLTDLHNPALLPNADSAAERLVTAVRNDESIAIYGDYDVDGITATAILYHIIKTASPAARITTYVPHRLEEGYGVKADALRQLRAAGVDLVISVDCGITACEPAKVAREIGLDLIITDHHTPAGDGAPLPEALVVHPRLPGSDYPFGDLCGAGVAFKLAWRFATCWCNSERVSENLQIKLLDMLPLAALGTIADVMPLLGENRTITTFGLRLIRQTPLAGLRALIEASNLMDEQIDSQKVGFILAPQLNACGRMGHAAEAVHMFTDADPEEAAVIARRLIQLNRQRQKTERGIIDEAARMAEDAGMTADDRRAIVLADPGWHQGVVGIVCSRLVERFGRPTILMQRYDDYCKGSARSINGYSIHDALAANAEYLTTYGGHDAAAGLTLKTDNLPAFAEALIEHANTNIPIEHLVPSVQIDCDTSLDELDMAVVKHIASLSPFGRANRRPVVRVRDAVLAENPRQIGSQGRHLSLKIRQDHDGRRRVIRGVWWRNGSLAVDLAPGMRIDLAMEPKLNEWAGRVSVEAEIRDVMVRPA